MEELIKTSRVCHQNSVKISYTKVGDKNQKKNEVTSSKKRLSPKKIPENIWFDDEEGIRKLMLKFHKKYKAWHQLQYYVLSAYASDKNLLMENSHWDTVDNLVNFASSYSMPLHVKSDPLIDLKKTIKWNVNAFFPSFRTKMVISREYWGEVWMKENLLLSVVTLSVTYLIQFQL